MAYLYGDSTPFPLGENFIETLRGITDTCVSLLQADESIERVRAEMESENGTAERDLAGVERLATALQRTMESLEVDPNSGYVGEVFARVVSSAREVFDGAARTVVGRRDSGLMQSESRLAAERARIPQAIESFLLKQELPGTEWSMNWVSTVNGNGQNQVNGWALARTPQGFEVTFELDLTGSALWARGFKVSELKPEITARLPKKGKWNSGAALREERLDRLYVSEVSISPAQAVLTLRRSLKSGSPGLEFSVPLVAGESGNITVVAKPVDDAASGDDSFELESLDASAVESLIEVLRARLRPLLTQRSRMVQSTLGGTPLVEVESPAAVARLLIAAAAPFVREMVRRSAVSGELSLKREVENGRREELFISVQELTDKFGILTPARQSYFEEFGLVYDLAGGSSTAGPGLPGSPLVEVAGGGSAARQVVPTGPIQRQE